MRGRKVSESQVDRWVAEAEKGYDPEALRRRGRPGRGAQPATVVAVRLTEEELRSLTAAAQRRNLNRSEAIRQALHEWTAA